MSRRNLTARFLRASIAVWLVVAGLAAQTRSVTLLHTNDLHARLLSHEDGSGGFAALAALIRQERAGCGGCLLVNAGDLVQGSPVSTIYRGLPVYRIANLFGYDVATIGNHEFDYGWQRVREFEKTAKYPLVAANVVDEGGRLLLRKPYVIRKVNGVRVAVMGAVTNDLGVLTTPVLLGQWSTTPLVETVRRYAVEARAKADLIVLLAHVTDKEEVELLASAPEVPVIITGHVHRGIPAAMEREGRVLVRTKAVAEELGRLELQVDVKAKSVTSWKWRQIPVAAPAKPASDVAKAVAHWEREVSKVVDVQVAESRRAFNKAETRAIIERAMCERTGADFAFMNAGGVRDVLPRGRVMARHVWNIMPFDNKVVIGKFKGSRLPETVTAGKTVDPDREYVLATSDFSAANQSSRTELRTTGLVFSQTGPLLRDVLLDWVKAKKTLD
ncbi:MAG TPA: bifunctional UDP-sugar hydrolase/5'-nucleotidase [Bryobacteraceae bacterium]|nr:bifunctional UDP-sugar hydrolase/5'-nucleotidase [Bryobacteraceae bacterium]